MNDESFLFLVKISDLRILSGWIEKYKPDLSISDSSWDNSCCMKLVIQSNLYKITTFGTTQKCFFWAGGRLIKRLYKTTTNQIWSLLAGF